jgi:cell division inhibitor SulA
MDNLATQNQPQALAQYSRSQADRTYADQYETLLGHLICERGRGVKSALEDLRPIVSQTRRQTINARDWCMKLGFGGVGVGVLVGAGMGIGFAVLPIIAGTISIKFWADSRSEMPRRDAEYHLLKTAPNLPEALYAMHLRGIQAVQLVGAYDQLVGAIEARLEGEGDFTEHEVAEFLKTKVDNASVIDETLTQSRIQNGGAEEAPKTESAALAQTELQPIAPGVAASPSMQVINGVETIAPRDIATDLGNNPQSALIFGTPGAGKGMTISNAIRTLRAKLPNVTVMMVDPKGDKKERGYWESQVDIFESRALLKSSPRSSAEWMMRCVEKFQDIDGPKLLVWDELFASITVLKGQNIPKGEDAFPCLTDFQQFISLNLSLGPSSGTWVWGMSQSANLSDLGLTSGGLSTTRIIALISPDNVGAVEGYLATKAITAPKGGMETLDRLMEQSPVGRACYDGKTKRWYPTAKLENHSGFDRDTADWNSLGTATTDTRSRSEIQASIESLKVEAAETVKFWEDQDTESDLKNLTPSERLERAWVAPSAIEVEAVEVQQSHPLKDKFDRVESLLEGEDSITVKEIQTKLKIKTSTEAQQLAQMFCLKQKSRYRFGQKANPNGTVSYFIETLT